MHYVYVNILLRHWVEKQERFNSIVDMWTDIIGDTPMSMEIRAPRGVDLIFVVPVAENVVLEKVNVLFDWFKTSCGATCLLGLTYA